MDVIYDGKAHGPVAATLLRSGMNVNSLRTNAVLRKDEWKQYDTAVIDAAQTRLVGIADLYAKGLIYNTNGLGKTVLEYEDVSDIEDAQVNMSGVERGQNDRLEFDLRYLPLPITHKDFQMNIRVLSSSRTTGESLDTMMAQRAARKVADKLEEYLFNGSGTTAYTFGGGSIYGYETHPYRTTGSLTAGWDDSGADPVTDVIAMKQASIDDRFYGPWYLYIPTAYETQLDKDYVSGYPKTIRQRIMEIGGVESMKVADKLTADSVILTQMTSDVVRLVVGLPLTTVEWSTEGNMVFHFKVMTIAVPDMRYDQNQRSGVVHYSE